MKLCILVCEAGVNFLLAQSSPLTSPVVGLLRTRISPMSANELNATNCNIVSAAHRRGRRVSTAFECGLIVSDFRPAWNVVGWRTHYRTLKKLRSKVSLLSYKTSPNSYKWYPVYLLCRKRTALARLQFQ